jgi:hypothetical protein
MVMKKFNGNILDLKMKMQLEEYFEHRWSYNKNWSIEEEADLIIMDQVPINVQQDLLTNFLFQDFGKCFSNFFTWMYNNNLGHRTLISYQNDDYVDFMIDVFKSLNPIFFHSG